MAGCSIGRSGSPRKLNVEGEKSGKVAYRLIDARSFTQKNILVVGGGDSAVEAAVSLAEQEGNIVHLSYRREGLFRIKEGNRANFKKAVDSGIISPLFSSEVRKIESETVTLEQDGKLIQIPNDQVFVMIGGELPTEFLKTIGIEFKRKFGEKLDV